MRKLQLLFAVGVSAMLLSSCTKDALSDITLGEAEKMAAGSWRVTYYVDDSDGVSNDFDGYTFEINDDGSVTAAIGALSHSGSWAVKNSDDDPDHSKEIEFMISGDDQMDKLDGSWYITDLTETTMQLIDDTPGEEIHFEKI